MKTIKPMHASIVYGIAALLLILGIFRYMDMGNYTYLGYQSNDFEITRVEEGSPADTAGLQLGDQLLSIDGLDVRDSKSWDSKPRPKVGETRTFVVNRGGEELEMQMTYAPRTGKGRTINIIGWIMGLVYLIMGVWAFRSRKSWSSLLFAFFALAFASTFLGRPYIADPALRDIVNSVFSSFLLLGFAFLFSFLLHFPFKSSFMDLKNANLIVFGPAVVMSLVIIVLNILDPQSTSGLNQTIELLFLLFIIFYFGGSVILLVRRFLSADADERSNSGLSLLFWGAIIGILPMLIIFIIGNLSPTTVLPGEDYLFLTMAVIPVFFALAIKKSGEVSVES